MCFSIRNAPNACLLRITIQSRLLTIQCPCSCCAPKTRPIPGQPPRFQIRPCFPRTCQAVAVVVADIKISLPIILLSGDVHAVMRRFRISFFRENALACRRTWRLTQSIPSPIQDESNSTVPKIPSLLLSDAEASIPDRSPPKPVPSGPGNVTTVGSLPTWGSGSKPEKLVLGIVPRLKTLAIPSSSTYDCNHRTRDKGHQFAHTMHARHTCES